MRTTEKHNSLSAPAPFLLTSCNTAELREGGGWISLFGVPFFLAGVYLSYMVGRVVLVKGLPSRVQVVGFALMSLVFLGAGGAMLFGRRSLTLDIASGSLVRSISVLIPIRSESRRLNEFNAVVIAFELGDADSPDRYPVRLRAITAKDFTVCSPTQFAESRIRGEFLSRFLRLPLADTTTDHEVVVSAERARDTLRERLLSAGSQTERVEPPAALQSEVSQSAGKATIVIPTRKSLSAVVLAAFTSSLLLALVVPAIWRYLSRTDIPITSRFLFVSFAVLFFVILPFGAISMGLGAIRNRTVVTASSAGIVIERRGVWRTRTTMVSADGILDVDFRTIDGMLESARRNARFPQSAMTGKTGQRVFAALRKYVPTKGIIVKSRQGLVTFGEGLAAEELTFLKWVVTKALTQ